ncbi:hypothetical protein ACFZB9_10320 [Kitasatospora sp. NPDC008050]|uniref:hypothetical protein n=1 Tax=Kitasatospora sp. NPDC008050 TaxID=3364021 RepID=UPI0036E3207B
MELIWETGREFVLARYVASHQQLLFRSDKGMGGASRMEILFGPVQYLSLGCDVYEHFNIFGLTTEELARYSGGLYEAPPESCKIYGLGGTEIRGLVVAPGYVSTEDDGMYWEPSTLLRFDS